ncbi:oligopeptide transporter 4-like protein, partial [Trifolium pratense]
AVASFLYSPLISPFFAIVNTFVGYAFVVYAAIPIAYWGFNVYGANKFPIFSSDLFTAQGQQYNISAIVNDKFEIDLAKYHDQGRINMSMFFALTYGFGFATIDSTITHVVCLYGREIMERYHASTKGKEDIHTKLMKNYKDIPSCIITATANQTPGLNIITEYIFGLIYTGRPIANVCFKTYGYISMAQAV